MNPKSVSLDQMLSIHRLSLSLEIRGWILSLTILAFIGCWSHSAPCSHCLLHALFLYFLSFSYKDKYAWKHLKYIYLWETYLIMTVKGSKVDRHFYRNACLPHPVAISYWAVIKSRNRIWVLLSLAWSLQGPTLWTQLEPGKWHSSRNKDQERKVRDHQWFPALSFVNHPSNRHSTMLKAPCIAAW